MFIKIVVTATATLILVTTILAFFIFFNLNTFDIKCIAKGGIPNHNFQSNVCFKPSAIIQVD